MSGDEVLNPGQKIKVIIDDKVKLVTFLRYSSFGIKVEYLEGIESEVVMKYVLSTNVNGGVHV